MANLSNYEQTYLSAAQQEDIKKYKQAYDDAQKAYGAATDEATKQQYKAAMDAAHAGAEKVRAGAGFSGGQSGSGAVKLGANSGGQTYEQLSQKMADYKATNWDPKQGWVNGYSVDMNTRSRANEIRQQMEANSKAWHTADETGKAYLHEQNKLLAGLLAESTGHDSKMTEGADGKVTGRSFGYDPATGKWWTDDSNNGYGRDVTYDDPDVRQSHKDFFGYTDREMDDWANNRAGLYYNFVDASTPGRNQVDESSGFSGVYAPFANGAHGALVGRGTNEVPLSAYANVLGDGWNDEQDYAMVFGTMPTYDENGNIIKRPTAVKSNNPLSDYTRQFTAYTQNGVIMPNTLQQVTGKNSYTNVLYEGGGKPVNTYKPNVNDGNNMAGQLAHIEEVKKQNGGLSPQAVMSGSRGGSSGGGTLEQIYDSALKAQLAALESGYNSNLAQLDSSAAKMEDTYTEQRRQTTGQAEKDAAAWREMANAYGLNTGTIGQGQLAANNQLQSDLGTINRQQAATVEELEQQRIQLGKEYQLAIQQAVAENDYQKAQALYNEAVRVQEQLVQQMQFAAQMSLQQQQLDSQNAQWAAEFAAAQQAAAQKAASGEKVITDPYSSGNIYQLYRDAYESGNAESYLANNAKNYGVKSTTGLVGNYEDWYNLYGIGQNRTDEVAASLANRLSNSAIFQNRSQQIDLIEEYESKGLITPAQAAQLYVNFGLVG